MLPHSAYEAFQASQPDAQSTLDQKAGAPTGAAAQSKAGLQNEVAGLTPRSVRFAQSGAFDAPDESPETSSVPVPDNLSPAPIEGSASAVPELSDEHNQSLQDLGYDADTIQRLNAAQIRTIIKHQLPAKYVAPSHDAPAGSPFAKPADTAAPILAAEPNLDDATRATIWDAYHKSKTPDQFADAVTPIPVSNNLKHRLWTQKTLDVQPVAVAPVDKVVSAIQKMVALPADVLKTANEHPELLRAYVSAATKG